MVVEDRQAVGHVVPLCYPKQLSHQLSGSASPGNKTLTASWTRPATPPPEYAALGYTALSANAPLIAANRYGESPLIPDQPCTPLLPGHRIAISGINGNLAAGGGGEGSSATASGSKHPGCRQRATNTTARLAAAPGLAGLGRAVAAAPAPAPARSSSLDLRSPSASPFSGLIATKTFCSDTVTLLGQLSKSGSVAYFGQGTGSSLDLINGFNVAIDTTGRVLYALGAYEGAVETVSLFGFEVDTGALVSSCKTPLYSPPAMGRDMFLAFDPASASLLVSGCSDQLCQQPVPVGLLNPASCTFKTVASLGVLGQSGAYESAAFNSRTQQVVFTLSNLTSASIVALNLTDGTFAAFQETQLDNVDSLSYDAASGLIYGIGQSGSVASLVAINSSGLSFDIIGQISQSASAWNGLGAVGGAMYYFFLSDPHSGLVPPTLASVDLATGKLLSTNPIQYCEDSISDCPTTLAYQP